METRTRTSVESKYLIGAENQRVTCDAVLEKFVQIPALDIVLKLSARRIKCDEYDSRVTVNHAFAARPHDMPLYAFKNIADPSRMSVIRLDLKADDPSWHSGSILTLEERTIPGYYTSFGERIPEAVFTEARVNTFNDHKIIQKAVWSAVVDAYSTKTRVTLPKR